MLVKTKHFGDIDLDDSKILTFDDGILGFENCKNIQFYIIMKMAADRQFHGCRALM